MRRFVAAVALAASLAACSGDDATSASDDKDTGSSTTIRVTTTTTAAPETTTTTAAPTPEQEVLVAYQAYWQAVVDAFDPPQADPGSAALRQYASGEVLTGIINAAQAAKDTNKVEAKPPDSKYGHRATVVLSQGDTATVRDCNINDMVQTDTTSGKVLDNKVVTILYVAQMSREANQWKVSALNRTDRWDGIAGCALETS